jgi:hypothetical protein
VNRAWARAQLCSCLHGLSAAGSQWLLIIKEKEIKENGERTSQVPCASSHLLAPIHPSRVRPRVFFRFANGSLSFVVMRTRGRSCWNIVISNKEKGEGEAPRCPLFAPAHACSRSLAVVLCAFVLVRRRVFVGGMFISGHALADCPHLEEESG